MKLAAVIGSSSSEKLCIFQWSFGHPAPRFTGSHHDEDRPTDVSLHWPISPTRSSWPLVHALRAGDRSRGLGRTPEHDRVGRV
jgi:hypothetical protein